MHTSHHALNVKETKPTHPHPLDLYVHPLPVPDDHFDTITLDFISPLPEENGKNTILTMMDLLGTDIQITGLDIHCCPNHCSII